MIGFDISSGQMTVPRHVRPTSLTQPPLLNPFTSLTYLRFFTPPPLLHAVASYTPMPLTCLRLLHASAS